MPCSLPQNLDAVLTPSRKRKRDEDNRLKSNNEGLSNDGFLSTPGKEAKCTVLFKKANSEVVNRACTNPFLDGSSNYGLEVKSIADLANEQTTAENPYEIVRKPPKKKKKAQLEEVCFENSALNLDGPERRFNPFEVQRNDIIAPTTTCFTNSALDIKSPENAAVNPYEITRTIDSTFETTREGIENPGLEDPTSVTIALPFRPTIGCRIDFNGIALDNLTPSKLFAEKLVFSPPPGFKGSTLKKSFRRSLSVISEETVDIGKELDCYQLELENSINEAKLKKKPCTNAIKEDEIREETPLDQHENNKSSISINITNINISIGETSPASVQTPPVATAPETADEANNSDVSFDDELDFKEPAPFVRCYRKTELPRTRSEEICRENNVSKGSSKSNDETGSHKHKFSSVIRKSIRKLIGSNHHHKKEEHTDGKVNDQQSSEAKNLLSTLRHSVRRKNNKNPPACNNPQPPEEVKPDVSIIDTTEKRKVFKINGGSENNNEKHVVNEKPLSFRRSLRKSTRDIRNQVMKRVFHKNVEEYQMKD